MANGTEFIDTNSTEDEYFNQQFDSGFTTILPEQIREAKFAFHGNISGLILCTILSGDNDTIIDREIIENTKSYKLYKIDHLHVIHPAGMMIFLIYSLFQVFFRNTINQQRSMLDFL